MKVYLAADHAGFELKEEIKIFLRGLGYEVEDQGAFTFNQEDDYPDFMLLAAKRVAAEPDSRGLLFGASGEGEAMVANRLTGIRAAVFYGGAPEIISLSRTHNNANILSLGARFIKPAEAKPAIKEWLQTDFSGAERHARRIKKIDQTSQDLANF